MKLCWLIFAVLLNLTIVFLSFFIIFDYAMDSIGFMGFAAVGSVVVVILASGSCGGSAWFSIIVVHAVVCSCHIISTCWGPCIISGVTSFYCCVWYKGDHMLMPSQ